MKYALGMAPRTVRPRCAAAAVSVLLGAAVVLRPGIVALLLPAVVGVFALLILVRCLGGWSDDPEVQRRIRNWSMFAFVTHLAFGLLVSNVGGFVETYLRAPDSYTYHSFAVDILGRWTIGLPGPDLPAGKEGFYYMLAGIYWVVGAHTAAGLAVNATLAAAVVPLMTDATSRLFGAEAAKRVPPLVALLPGLFLWSAQLLKEAPILFLIAVATMCAVRILDRSSLGAMFGLALSLSLLFTFRAWVALVVAGGMAAGLVLGRRQLASGIGVGLAAVGLVVGLVALGLGASGYRAAVETDLAQANAVRQDLATAGSGFDADVDVSTSSRALSYLPRGLTTFLFGPFPWQIRSARQLPAVPDVVVWWLLIPSLWRGLRAATRLAGRKISILLLPAATTAILLALSIGNFGTVVRERAQVTILLLPLIALGLSLRPAARREEEQGSLPPGELPAPVLAAR